MNNPFAKILELYKAGFRQRHEATCGPASIILASMGLGLELRQESEWINSHFTCWIPVEQFLERGMALHELHFISELIYGPTLEINSKRSYPENFPLFLSALKNSFDIKDSIIIVNYRQADFIANTKSNEQGEPHYSPIIDWDRSKNKVMIADVDFNIKKPYWVNLEDIFQSMSHCNPAIGLPRGWLVLRKRE